MHMPSKRRKPIARIVIVPEEVQSRIVTLYRDEELTIRKVAKKVGYGTFVVTRTLNEKKVPRRVGGMAPDTRTAMAKQFYEDDVAVTKVAHDHEVGCGAVYAAVRAEFGEAAVHDHNVGKPPLQHTDEERARAVELYTGEGEDCELGCGATAVALAGEDIIMNVSTVRKAVIDAGVLRRAGGEDPTISPEAFAAAKNEIDATRGRRTFDDFDTMYDPISSDVYDDDDDDNDSADDEAATRHATTASAWAESVVAAS